MNQNYICSFFLIRLLVCSAVNFVSILGVNVPLHFNLALITSYFIRGPTEVGLIIPFRLHIYNVPCFLLG